jgi:hypothetical protein
VDVQIHVFLTSALVVGEWSASRPCRFTPAESAQCPFDKWVDPRAGLNDMRANSVALVGEWTKPTERPPLVGEVSVNLYG